MYRAIEYLQAAYIASVCREARKVTMNDPMNVNALCPYYLRHSKIRVPQGYADEIVCESIYSTKKLGFEVEQSTKFNSKDEYKAFASLFCCDMYETCPTYKAILSSREAEAAAEERRAAEQRAAERSRKRIECLKAALNPRNYQSRLEPAFN